MAEPARSSYDEVVYDSRAHGATHPDRMATLATLLGMRPASVERCRVLELGCATAGNLLPLADALPQAEFVGIDQSARQIAMGRRVAESLGMKNLRLEARSILDLDASLGTFDYIIAHGVYSWVSAEVRDALLRACRGHLAPHGVAYISYNTYPGWHTRGPVAEMMSYHVRGVADPREKVRQARDLLNFLAASVLAEDSAWGQALRGEAELVAKEADWYVFHEHLEEVNHAVYFHQFIEHARAAGLRYLGEAEVHATLTGLRPEVQEGLRRLSADLLQLEQNLDFVRNRGFRRTLLVHEEVQLNRTASPDVVFGLQASSRARPVDPTADPRSGEPLDFKNDQDVTVTTSLPLTKAALLALYESWPQALGFDELCAAVAGRLGGLGMPEAEARALLARSLVHLYLSNLAGLHTYLPPIVTRPGERPSTTPLIRLQASTGAAVVNRRHQYVRPSVPDLAVLALLDGSRDRAGIEAALVQRVLRGELELRRDGQPVTDPAAVAAVVQAELEGCLHRLGQSSVLVA
jgi:methyltransferase-like protein/2-polyprenyl-3-methyl-5-hydroxy-6-metoxy-1,4-benzoquinol methylase